MTATTKEQRAAASIYIEKHTALQATFPADFVLALLNDSERLAAIEAVTGEEVQAMAQTMRDANCGAWANALLSLSSKVAEQAEEIERMKRVEYENNDLMKRTTELYRRSCERNDEYAKERDTLRRLLTETAVPALESIAAQPLGDMTARDALTAIRAQMEGGNA